jgi:hypothetical protein
MVFYRFLKYLYLNIKYDIMTEQKYIKLSEYARKKSITYRTAWKHFKCNQITGAFKDNTGHVYVPFDNIFK